MSIIYSALQRLESADPLLVRGVNTAELPELTEDSGNGMLMGVALAALTVLVALSVTFLQRYGEVDAGPHFAPVPGANYGAAGEYRGEQGFVSIQNADRGAASGNDGEPLSPATGALLQPEFPPPADPAPAVGAAEPAAAAAPATPDAADVRIAEVEILAPLSESPAPPDLVAALDMDFPDPEIELPAPEAVVPDPEPRTDPPRAVRGDSPDTTIDRAEHALARGNYLEALTALDTIQPVPRDRADFWLIKGSAHLAIGQLDQADSAFQSARQLMPDNAQIIVQQAIVAQERGDHGAALKILEVASKRHPDVPEIFLNMGYSQQALGAVQDARRSFHTFLRMTERRSLYSQQRKAILDWLAQVEPEGH